MLFIFYDKMCTKYNTVYNVLTYIPFTYAQQICIVTLCLHLNLQLVQYSLKDYHDANIAKTFKLSLKLYIILFNFE